MNPEDFQIDPDSIVITDDIVNFEQEYEEGEQRQAYQEQQRLAQEQEAAQATAELNDPRTKEGGGGLKGVVKEVQSAIGG